MASLKMPRAGSVAIFRSLLLAGLLPTSAFFGGLALYTGINGGVAPFKLLESKSALIGLSVAFTLLIIASLLTLVAASKSRRKALDGISMFPEDRVYGEHIAFLEGCRIVPQEGPAGTVVLRWHNRHDETIDALHSQRIIATSARHQVSKLRTEHKYASMLSGFGMALTLSMSLSLGLVVYDMLHNGYWAGFGGSSLVPSIVFTCMLILLTLGIALSIAGCVHDYFSHRNCRGLRTLAKTINDNYIPLPGSGHFYAPAAPVTNVAPAAVASHSGGAVPVATSSDPTSYVAGKVREISSPTPTSYVAGKVVQLHPLAPTSNITGKVREVPSPAPTSNITGKVVEVPPPAPTSNVAGKVREVPPPASASDVAENEEPHTSVERVNAAQQRDTARPSRLCCFSGSSSR